MNERLDEVLAQLESLREKDVPVDGGRTLSYVYDSGLADADQAGRAAVASFAGTNGLDPTAFPSLLAMERDLLAMVGAEVHAPEGYAGVVTSGGTESILLAVLAARDGTRPPAAGQREASPAAAGQREASPATAGRGGGGQPSMIAPSTAHAAFHKAAHYFGLRLVLVDVDPVTFRADPEAMADAIDESTVLLVASAPSYAHGVLDPVARIAELGARHGIRVHVDACIGGWILPFIGSDVEWDFRLPGVTSISVDLHKYGYSPKGVSVLLHREARLRRGHYFAAADWPGYTMLNATMQSTKSGGPLAAAWAVARVIGRERYRDLAVAAHEAAVALGADFARPGAGLRTLAPPETTLLAVTAEEDLDVYTVADEMSARGWLVPPQLPWRGGPASLHLSLCAATASRLDELRTALRESVAAARRRGPARPEPAVAELLAGMDPGALDEQTFGAILAGVGLGSGSAAESGEGVLPERMAHINALLAAAPPALRESLLLAFLERLTMPGPGIP